MRIENILLALKAKQYSVMEDTFKKPPQTFDDFKKCLGRYLGISECINFIEEERKKDED